MPEETVIDRLRWITEEHLQGKQSSLAQAMRCGSPYISALFNGARTNPSGERLDNLVVNLRERGVNISREWLLFGQGERYSIGPNSSLLEDRPASRVEVRSDFEAVTRWIAAGWNETELKGYITRAVETGRSDVARVLLDLLDQRFPTNSSSAEEDAASLDDLHDQAVDQELQESEPKPSAAAPSARKPERQRGA